MTSQNVSLNTVTALYMEAYNLGENDRAAAEEYLAPYVDNGQVVMGTARQGDEEKHFGFALWAKVDEDTHMALSKGALDPKVAGYNALKSGPAAWLLELVAPSSLADAFVKSTCAAVFPNEVVMARLKDKDGTARCIQVQRAA
ncbi:toxin-activating lysine-acyltransferase [Yoonia litorea]|uniref:RTX toxin-activating lysine-acyltransferase n=1 Tax=Yoonia litorea TaxID=1123755 RepID=A0A1I6MZQ0_9RHOB|nr:toxin-activating lysine-acyltransferase [Yoonia litorea]SFS21185.1 ACP:hemolysin acyltransferase (hemolysin-activating protein) [Yoonia litorea]